MSIHKKIKNLSTEYILNQAANCFLLLLLSKLEEKNNESGNFNTEMGENHIPYKIHEDILDIKSKTSEFMLNLQETLENRENSTAYLNECIKLKKQLVNIYSNIYKYYSEWNILYTLIGDEISVRKYKEENTASKKIDFSGFYDDCLEFLNSAEHLSHQKKYLGQLFKCVPLQMTRDKYYDLIKKSLADAFSDETDKSVDISLDSFKQICAPRLSENFGEYFPEIAQWLTGKKNINPPSLTEEALDTEYNDFIHMFDMLQEIESYFVEIFDDINSFIIIFYVGLPFHDITQNEFKISDMYHSVCDIISGKISSIEKESINELLKENLENEIEKIIDKIDGINKKEFALLEKINEFEDLDESKTIASEGFIRSTYYQNINDELFNFDLDENSPKATAEYKERRINEFIKYIKDYFSSLPVQNRKLSMSLLLSSLPIVLTVEEFMEYLHMVFDNLTNTESKILVMDKVGTVFAHNGFSFENDEHEHNHDCDCEHDHDHDCGCGHNHNHKI